MKLQRPQVWFYQAGLCPYIFGEQQSQWQSPAGTANLQGQALLSAQMEIPGFSPKCPGSEFGNNKLSNYIYVKYMTITNPCLDPPCS